jgi:hypothetical protein
MADIGGLIEGLAQATESWSGWRYLLSGSYRRKVHESWKEKSDARIFGEIIYGLFWIVFSITILVWCLGIFTGKGIFNA